MIHFPEHSGAPAKRGLGLPLAHGTARHDLEVAGAAWPVTDLVARESRALVPCA